LWILLKRFINCKCTTNINELLNLKIMNIKDFTTNFISQLDDDSLEPISKDENFRELDAWDSLTALSVMPIMLPKN
jgi:hypothetical protein